MTRDEYDETHFGFRKVSTTEKTNLVGNVFRSVAPKYDLMNDFMSFGLHRAWKQFVISEADLRPGLTVLDVAAGTGDLSYLLAKAVGKSGKVIMSDINQEMLSLGRDKLTDKNILGSVECILADAERLPFADNTFDRITIAFGLRNVTNKQAALQSMFRVLKPGGCLLILEFSKPTNAYINKLYEFYSFSIIPNMGKLVADDADSYQYLVESIRMHPKQEELKNMLQQAGFEDIHYKNLHNGIVALHKGQKY